MQRSATDNTFNDTDPFAYTTTHISNDNLNISEYICLSQCIRDLIPIRTIIKELATILNMDISDSLIRSTVFEDNKGAIELAKEPKYRPRTKHIGLKWHHFREHVKKGTVKILYIDTKEQLADCLTKPLPRPQYVQLRNGMGW